MIRHTKLAGLAVLVAVMLLSACAARIHGTVELVDADLKPLAKENPQGVVINLINTTAALQDASHSVSTDAKGKYQSIKDRLTPGKYKVEASRIGFATETQSVEITGSSSKKIDFKLKKIREGKRRSIRGRSTDKDKIINPGEVNIQPPTM